MKEAEIVLSFNYNPKENSLEGIIKYLEQELIRLGLNYGETEILSNSAIENYGLYRPISARGASLMNKGVYV